MREVLRGEILELSEYEKVREHFRARVVQEKKRRRVHVGPSLTFVFENHDTVLLQIQEMLRTERITKPASVEHEITTYNQLVPRANELSATVMIEIPDPIEREAFLAKAAGIEERLALVVDGERFAATWDPSRVIPGRASAVLYVKFPLSARAGETLRARGANGKPAASPGAQVELAVDHPVYRAKAALAAETIASIAEDLES